MKTDNNRRIKNEYPEEWAPFIMPLSVRLLPKHKDFFNEFIKQNKNSNNIILLLNILNELVEKLSPDLYPELLPLLNARGGATSLADKLPKTFSPESIITTPNSGVSTEQRVWELIGGYYLNKGRHHEALPIYAALYNHMLEAQKKLTKRVHKGMPLVWMSDCYKKMGYFILAKRYLMLTLCEDAIWGKGQVSPDETGVYFRLVWEGGLSDSELNRYVEEIYHVYGTDSVNSVFPEWILQELDQNWMTEIPSPNEAAIYIANSHYIVHLLSLLGEPTGKALERLAEYILSCMPGCRTTKRQRSRSTDYDIICSMEGFEIDFRSEFGRYFVCECKDWRNAANFQTMAKFCRILDSVKSRFGILFSKKGISGIGKSKDAEREQLKVFQDRGMVIVVIDYKDIEYVSKSGNFINLLRTKYETVRLDLISKQSRKSKRTNR